MVRVAVLALLVLAACDLPGPATRPPAELVFLPGADRTHAVYEMRDGTQVSTLAAGAFDATLTSGGDLGEAYLAAEDGVLYRVRAGHPLRVDRAADLRGRPPYQVALVPAPALTAFVGARTVMMVLTVDGVFSGYQSGSLIWRTGVLPGTVLKRVDDAAVLGFDGEWSVVAGESGRTRPLISDCPQGPLAAVHGSLVFGCSGAGDPGVSLPVPPGPAFDLRPARADAAVLAYPSGDWYRVDAGPKLGAQGHGPGGDGTPALSPDGKTIYWPSQVGARALAISRDGAFLYALDGSGLRVLKAAGHSQVARYGGISAQSIELVAGG